MALRSPFPYSPYSPFDSIVNMASRAAQIIVLWLMALAVAAHGLGGVIGGVLCFGCQAKGSGIAISELPCSMQPHCCLSHTDTGSPADSNDNSTDEHGCKCLDVTLARQDMVLHLPVFKLVAVHQLPPCFEVSLVGSAPCIQARGSVIRWRQTRHRCVDQLQPSTRQTVLTI